VKVPPEKIMSISPRVAAATERHAYAATEDRNSPQSAERLQTSKLAAKEFIPTGRRKSLRIFRESLN
jgi:hypothetical protein